MDYIDIFIKNNRKVDFNKIDLLNQNAVELHNWAKIYDMDTALKQLRSYQRIFKIIPQIEGKHKLIKEILKAGINSATRIAAMPKKQFIELPFFAKKYTLALQCYSNAVAVRTNILLKFMDTDQK